MSGFRKSYIRPATPKQIDLLLKASLIKYNRLNELYSMANGPKEMQIEMGNTKRSRSQRERERIMCPCSVHE